MALATSTKKQEGDAVHSQAYCEKLANTLSSLEDLPASCHKYAAVVDTLKSKIATDDPFAGMHSGAAVKARATRAKGLEHHAQIQRRLTSSGRRFSKLNK